VINCIVCGRLTPRGTRGPAKKYCSRECSHPRKTKTISHCLSCHAPLNVKTNAGRPRTTCSRKCRSELALSRAKESRQLDKNCFVCNKPFRTGKKAQRFCSYECRYTQHKIDHPHQRNTEPKVLVCGWCNNSLVVAPNFTGATKYHDNCRIESRRASYRIKTVRRQSRTVKPTRLSADQLVAEMGATCRICHKEIDMTVPRTSKMGLTVDHIIPLSKGGQDTLDNMQPAHWICNVKKGNKINA